MFIKTIIWLLIIISFFIGTYYLMNFKKELFIYYSIFFVGIDIFYLKDDRESEENNTKY